MNAIDEAVDAEELGLGFPAAAEVVGTICAVIPFVLNVTTSSTVTVDGVVESHRQTDWIALAGGGLALAMALWGLSLLGRTRPSAKSKRLIGCIVIAAVAAFQVARGFGLI